MSIADFHETQFTVDTGLTDFAVFYQFRLPM